MSDAKNASKPAIAARDFTDDGTKQSFLAGKPIDADEGTIANYRAAGLVAGDEPADDAVATDATTDDGKPGKGTKAAA